MNRWLLLWSVLVLAGAFSLSGQGPSYASGPAVEGAESSSDDTPLARYFREVKLFVLPADSPLRSKLMTAANRWLDAIAARDTDTLATFVLPESQDYMRERLRDPDYVVARSLMYEGFSTYQLANAERRGVMLLRTGTPLNPGPGVKVCVFNRASYNPQTDPQKIALYRQVYAGADVDCYFFFYGDGAWRFGFSAMEEGDSSSYDPPEDGE